MGLRAIVQSRWALICAIVLVQFGLFEVAFRLEAGSEAAPAFQRLFLQDPRVGHRLAPGVSTRYTTSEFDTVITVNHQGVRGPEIGPKSPDERRVVVLGDSLVLAVQVPYEQTFTDRLERALNASALAPRTYRVINGGVQGYGPVEEYLFHQYVTSPLAPDVVVMALYVGNDAIEAAASGLRKASGTPTTSAPPPSRFERFTLWRRRMIRRSMVLQIVRLRVTTLLGRFGWHQEVDAPLRTYLPDAVPEIVRGLAITHDVVARMKALTGANGQRLVIMLMPARFQVEDGDYRQLKAIVEESGKTLERDLATVRFKQMLTDLDVPVFDVLPALRAAPEPGRLYFTSTAHFTPYGHEVVARALGTFLRQAGLVDTRGAQ
jgi:hypothetical protein